MYNNDLNLPTSFEEFSLVSTLSGRIIYCCSELISYLSADLTGRNLNEILPEQICVDIFQNVRVPSSLKSFEVTIMCRQFHCSAEVFEDELNFILTPHNPRSSPAILENTAAHISRAISSSISTILPLHFRAKKHSADPLSVAIMEKEFMRLFRLSKNIGDYAVLQSGQFTINYKVYDICEFMAELINKIKEVTTDLPITFTLIAPNTPHYINFDKEKIERAMLNFLTNAIQSISGEGRVDVVLRPLEKTGMSILIRDTGRGCNPDQLARISRKHSDVGMFESDFRGGAGFGYGLATTFFELHGGRCVMISTPGKGSILTLTLPRNADKVPPTWSDIITDYAGGYNHIKLELAQVLPPEAYLDKKPQ